jgi:hypothetical protein
VEARLVELANSKEKARYSRERVLTGPKGLSF